MPTGRNPVNFYDYLLKKGISEHDVCTWMGIKPGLYYNLPPVSKLPRLSLPLGAGVEDVMYAPTLVQRQFHACAAENRLLEGPRGTGKSLALRFDAHMRARSVEGWKYLILRRKLTDLRKNHLLFVDGEMKKLGGKFNKTDNIAYYTNGSVGFYSYCVTIKDIENLLSSEWGAIYLDEWTTFPWEWVVKIASSIRVSEEGDMVGFLAGGTNPLGVGASHVKKYFITKTVRPEEDPEYRPENYVAIHTRKEDNPHLDWSMYLRRLGSLQGATRSAWLEGEWATEGAFFPDFHPTRDGRDWHVIHQLPGVQHAGLSNPFPSWVRIYRALDWGYRPDPAVCLWVAVFPNTLTIVFKERTWKETLPKKVAEDIKRESEGMRVVETFADPSIFARKGESEYSVGEMIENGGIPLTRSINDRERIGPPIWEYLNSTVTEIVSLAGQEVVKEYPTLQILAPSEGGRMGCPNLIRTLPEMQADPSNPKRMDDGEDHYVVTLAYFCLGDTPPPKEPGHPNRPRWMMGKREFARSWGTSV